MIGKSQSSRVQHENDLIQSYTGKLAERLIKKWGDHIEGNYNDKDHYEYINYDVKLRITRDFFMCPRAYPSKGMYGLGYTQIFYHGKRVYRGITDFQSTSDNNVPKYSEIIEKEDVLNPLLERLIELDKPPQKLMIKSK